MELKNSFVVDADRETTWKVLNDVELIAPCLPGAQLQEIEGDVYRGVVKVKVGPITAQYKGQASFVDQDEEAGKVVLKADGRDIRGSGNASALITATMAEEGNATRVDVLTDLAITGKVAQFGRGVMTDVSSKLMAQFADNLRVKLEDEAEAQADREAVMGEGQPEQTSSEADETGGVTETADAGSASAETPQPAADTAQEASSATEPNSDEAASSDADTGASEGETTDSKPQVRKIDSPEVEAVDLLDAAGAPVLKRLVPVLAGLVGLFVLRRVFKRKNR